MKFYGLLTLALFFAMTAMRAQEISEHALGLRLGDSDGFGAEISYQKSIGQANRAEVNLGWRDSRNFSAFKLAGVYQWVRPIENGFNWYYGAGAGVGSVDFSNAPLVDEGGAFVFAAGNIGIEYNFDIPLLLSLDFRPELGLVGYDGFGDSFDFDIGLGIRYQF
ncbi:hypothetical protein [Maribacter sp. 2307ULW6-5]|uniref:hypothetical protein n=1 Tax=Maribacter sp. 2307ULW6-5 TaxID=3386275 RepID=UPI0039BD89DF